MLSLRPGHGHATILAYLDGLEVYVHPITAPVPSRSTSAIISTIAVPLASLMDGSWPATTMRISPWQVANTYDGGASDEPSSRAALGLLNHLLVQPRETGGPGNGDHPPDEDPLQRETQQRCRFGGG